MYQIFIMMLKFDFFFFLGFSVQYLALLILTSESSLTTPDAKSGIVKQLVEHIVLSCVVTIAMLLLAFWGVSWLHVISVRENSCSMDIHSVSLQLVREKKQYIYGFIIGSFASMAYFIYMLVEISQHPQNYQGTKIFLTFFCKWHFSCLATDWAPPVGILIPGPSLQYVSIWCWSLPLYQYQSYVWGILVWVWWIIVSTPTPVIQLAYRRFQIC